MRSQLSRLLLSRLLSSTTRRAHAHTYVCCCCPLSTQECATGGEPKLLGVSAALTHMHVFALQGMRCTGPAGCSINPGTNHRRIGMGKGARACECAAAYTPIDVDMWVPPRQIPQRPPTHLPTAMIRCKPGPHSTPACECSMLHMTCVCVCLCKRVTSHIRINCVWGRGNTTPRVARLMMDAAGCVAAAWRGACACVSMEPQRHKGRSCTQDCSTEVKCGMCCPGAVAPPPPPPPLNPQTLDPRVTCLWALTHVVKQLCVSLGPYRPHTASQACTQHHSCTTGEHQHRLSTHAERHRHRHTRNSPLSIPVNIHTGPPLPQLVSCSSDRRRLSS